MEADASCAEPETASAPPAILLPLNDGTDYPVSQEQCREWADLYPSADVMQQLRNMRGWLLSNPDRRKTKRGICRFITRWLAKEQDRGGTREYPDKPAYNGKVPYGSAGRVPLGEVEQEALARMLEKAKEGGAT